jgi:hypothetical protein
MAAGDLITEIYQYEYNGLLLGADSDFEIDSITGLSGYPAVRTGTVDRFGRHGGIPGRHYLPLKDFTVQFSGVPASNVAFKDLRDAVATAFAVRTDPTDEIPFVLFHPGRDDKLYIDARPIALDIPMDREWAIRYPHFSVRFEASYPFFRGLNTKTSIILSTGDATGLTLPLSFPLDFGTATANSGSALNIGTAPAHWFADIHGPAVDPVLEESTLGKKLSFSGLTINAGEFLRIDSITRSILLNNQSSRRHYLEPASSWFQLNPGQATGIKYSQSGASPSTCFFKWHDTYWSD